MVALIEQRGQQDDGLQRLAAGLRHGDESSGGRNVAGLEHGLDSQRTRLGQVGPQRFARLLGDEKGQNRSALGAAGVFLETEQRVEDRIPAAPGHEFALPRGKGRQRLRQPRGARVAYRLRRDKHERVRPRFFRFDQLEAKLRQGGRAQSGLPQQRRADRLQVDRQRPRPRQHHHPTEAQRQSGRHIRGGALGCG